MNVEGNRFLDPLGFGFKNEGYLNLSSIEYSAIRSCLVLA